MSRSKGCDGLPQLSRSGQNQPLLVRESTALSNSELSSEPFWREYIRTGWLPGVFPWMLPSPVWGLSGAGSFLPTIPSPPHLLQPPSRGFLVCHAQLVQPLSYVARALLIVQYLPWLPACTCPAGKKKVIILSKSAAHKPRFSKSGLITIQFPKVEILHKLIEA